jgi:hypothetical protein
MLELTLLKAVRSIESETVRGDEILAESKPIIPLGEDALLNKVTKFWATPMPEFSVYPT